jgi:hypothetical protein
MVQGLAASCILIIQLVIMNTIIRIAYILCIWREVGIQMLATSWAIASKKKKIWQLPAFSPGVMNRRIDSILCVFIRAANITEYSCILEQVFLTWRRSQ